MQNNTTKGQNLCNSIFGPLAAIDESFTPKPEAVIDHTNGYRCFLCNYKIYRADIKRHLTKLDHGKNVRVFPCTDISDRSTQFRNRRVDVK